MLSKDAFRLLQAFHARLEALFKFFDTSIPVFLLFCAGFTARLFDGENMIKCIMDTGETILCKVAIPSPIRLEGKRNACLAVRSSSGGGKSACFYL